MWFDTSIIATVGVSVLLLPSAFALPIPDTGDHTHWEAYLKRTYEPLIIHKGHPGMERLHNPIDPCAHKRLPESFIKSSGFRTPIEVVMAGQELPPYPPEYRSCHMIHGTKRWPTTQKEPFYKKLYRGAVKGLEAFDFIVPVNHPARVSENQMYQDTLGYMMQKVGFDPEDPPTAPKSGGKHFEPEVRFEPPPTPPDSNPGVAELPPYIPDNEPEKWEKDPALGGGNFWQPPTDWKLDQPDSPSEPDSSVDPPSGQPIHPGELGLMYANYRPSTFGPNGHPIDPALLSPSTDVSDGHMSFDERIPLEDQERIREEILGRGEPLTGRLLITHDALEKAKEAEEAFRGYADSVASGERLEEMRRRLADLRDEVYIPGQGPPWPKKQYPDPPLPDQPGPFEQSMYETAYDLYNGPKKTVPGVVDEQERGGRPEQEEIPMGLTKEEYEMAAAMQAQWDEINARRAAAGELTPKPNQDQTPPPPPPSPAAPEAPFEATRPTLKKAKSEKAKPEISAVEACPVRPPQPAGAPKGDQPETPEACAIKPPQSAKSSKEARPAPPPSAAARLRRIQAQQNRALDGPNSTGYGLSSPDTPRPPSMKKGPKAEPNSLANDPVGNPAMVVPKSPASESGSTAEGRPPSLTPSQAAAERHRKIFNDHYEGMNVAKFLFGGGS